jgi:isopentenyl-diphosphate delta-isomerase
MSNVVLVNEKDQPLGVMEKLEAHQKGVLHRAFSVMLYRQNPRAENIQDIQDIQDIEDIEVLLQQRALGKYHGGGLWANTCCSHPEWEEPVIQGAYRRLEQEIFLHQPELLNLIKLEDIGSFIYRAELDQGLVEHELDHVFMGEYLGEMPRFNPDEIEKMEWISLKKLQAELTLNIEPTRKYAPWLAKVCEKIQKIRNF